MVSVWAGGGSSVGEAHRLAEAAGDGDHPWSTTQVTPSDALSLCACPAVLDKMRSAAGERSGPWRQPVRQAGELGY